MAKRYTNAELAEIAQARILARGKQGINMAKKGTATAVVNASKGATTPMGKKILMVGIPFIIFSTISAGKVTIGQDLPIWVDMVIGGICTLLFFQIVTALKPKKKPQPKNKAFDLNNLTKKEREQYEFYLYKATKKKGK